MAPAMDQPSRSFGPTNSTLPTISATPMGTPTQPSHGATAVVDAIEAATRMVQAPVNR